MQGGYFSNPPCELLNSECGCLCCAEDASPHVVCNVCQHGWCKTCNAAWHHNLSCDEYQRQVPALKSSLCEHSQCSTFDESEQQFRE